MTDIKSLAAQTAASVASQAQQAPVSPGQFAELMAQFQALQAQFVALQKAAPEAAKEVLNPPKEVEEKCYHTTLPGSVINIMRGPGICEVIAFVGDRLYTKDPKVQEYLDQIVDLPTSPVYSKSPQRDAAVDAATADVLSGAALVQDKLIKAGLRPN